MSDRISLVAAGCAFYAMLALFPALSLCISFYALWFDPQAVGPQLEVLRRLLPPEAYTLIAERIVQLIEAPTERLGLGALLGGVVALWSASAGIRALLGGLNLTQRRRETRSLLVFHLTALGLTLAAIIAVTVGLGALVALPAILDLVGLETREAQFVQLVSFGLLFGSVLAAIALLYRFGPSRPPPGWRLISRGSVLATLLWAGASAGFSLYVSRSAVYDATHGALGAAVALLTWFYVSVFVILLGAELDAVTGAVARRPPLTPDQAAHPPLASAVAPRLGAAAEKPPRAAMADADVRVRQAGTER